MPRGHQLTLSTKSVRAVVANFYAADRRIQAAARRVVKRNGEELDRKVYEATPVRTGYMQAMLQLRFTPKGLGYEVGWDSENFEGAGLPFYPVYVLFGTRFQPANDFFFPLRDEQDRIFKRELRDELRGAIRRRGR